MFENSMYCAMSEDKKETFRKYLHLGEGRSTIEKLH